MLLCARLFDWQARAGGLQVRLSLLCVFLGVFVRGSVVAPGSAPARSQCCRGLVPGLLPGSRLGPR